MDTNQTPEQLQAQLTAKTNEVIDLTRKLTAETSAHNTTKQELADANSLVDDLNKQLNSKSTAPAEHIVTLGVAGNAKKYRVTLPKFNYNGTVYKREDVKSNSDLLKELVEKGVVVELVEAAK